MVIIQSKTSPIEATIYEEAHPQKQVPIEIYQMDIPDRRIKGKFVKAWVINALYSKAMCAFSDTSEGLTAQDKRLMGRTIELQFPWREEDGFYKGDVWFGIAVMFSNSGFAPLIYLDDMFEVYQAGMTVEECASGASEVLL